MHSIRLPVQPNVRAGLSLFPENNACLVDEVPDVEVVELDAAGRSAIGDALDAVMPEGETPIAGATILSYKHLSAEILRRRIEGNTFVVLLTDGAETCKPAELPKLAQPGRSKRPAVEHPHVRDWRAGQRASEEPPFADCLGWWHRSGLELQPRQPPGR